MYNHCLPRVDILEATTICGTYCCMKDDIKNGAMRELHIKFQLLTTIALSLLMMGACSDNDNDKASSSTDVGQSVWYEVQSQDNYSIVEVARQSLIAKVNSGDTCCAEQADIINYLHSIITCGSTGTLRSVIIHYSSVDVEGNPIVLSGRIILRATDDGSALQNPSDILMSNHITTIADFSCPSRAMPQEAILAAKNVMVICPDYIGYGVTRSMAHPFLCAELTAHNSTDMAKAALQYLKDEGGKMKDGYGVFNEGYSQGGATALAIQKYIEQHADLNALLPLKATHCGDGPYDLVLTFEELENDSTISRPELIPFIIIGMKAGFPEIMKDVEIKDCFTDKFVNSGLLNVIRNKNKTVTEVNEIIKETCGNKINEILSAEILDDNSHIHKCFIEALKCNDLTTGWKPQHPVKFYHSHSDDVVPYKNMVNAVNGLGNDNVYWADVYLMSHMVYGITFYLKGISGLFLNDDFSTNHKSENMNAEQ